MKKLNKIFSVVLTAAIMTSLLVTSAIPAGAATQAWDKVTTPSTTNMMLNTSITAGGPIAQSPVDGKLYAYVLDTGVHTIIISEDGGRTWDDADANTTANFTVPVIDIIPSATEAGVIFVATADGVYRSDNFAGSFTPLFTVSGAADITSIDVGRYQGQYVIAVGTNALGDKAAGMYLWYETYLPGNLQQVGDTAFGEAVLDVALAPTFGTDRAIVAIGASGTVKVNVMGSDWGAIVANNQVATGPFTNAQLALPSDFSTANPNYFVAITGAGVFRVQGASEAAIAAPTGKNNNMANNIVVDGTFNSNAANLLVGFSDGTVRSSSNGGLSALSNVSLRSSIAATSWVLFDNEYATNKKAYVLNVGGMGGAFNVTTDGSTFNQWSLVNETISAIDDLAIAPNGDLFMITRNTDGAITVPAVTADKVTITSTQTTPLVAAVAQVTTVTPTAADNTLYILTITVGGTDYNFNYTSSAAPATAAEISAAFVALVNAPGPIPVTAAISGSDFTLTADVAGLAGAFTTADSGPGTLGFTATTPAADEVPAATTDTITINVTTGGVAVTGTAPGTGGTIIAGGSLTINFTAIGQTVILTPTVASTTGTTSGVSGTDGGVITEGANGTITTSYTSGGAFTLGDIAVAEIPSTKTSKIWRNFGGVWERVAVGITGDMIRVSPNYETDKAVFYAQKGSSAEIMVSTNNANKFSKMTTAPGSFVGGANTVESLFILDKDTVIVGSTGGIITKNNGPYIWIEKTSPSTDLVGTVTDIKRAGNGDLYAVSIDGSGDVLVAVSSNNGDTWSRLKVVGSATTPTPDAKLDATGSNAFLGLSDGQVFVAVDGGVYRYDTTDTVDGWLTVSTSTANPVTGTAVIMGSGNAFEGNNALFVADGNNAVVNRILGVTSVVENTEPITGLAASGVSKIFAVGNTLCVVGNDAKIYSYTDTLVTPVEINEEITTTTSSTGFFGLITAESTATINWEPLDKATEYTWAVVEYGVDTSGILGIIASAGTTTALTQAKVTGLEPDTTYYAYVWAESPVDSFMAVQPFATKPVAPSTPIDLAPEAGAIGVPVNPSFQWSVVPNATKYTVEVATDPEFNNIVKELETPIAAVAWNGESLTNNTVYYWRVTATTPTGTSAAVESVFTTVAAAPPAQTTTVTTPPAQNITLTVPTVDQETPGYIWIIIAIGGILTVLVIVLIVRTRRVV